MRFCIVGAGVVGTATAWHLAKSGHEVVVVEARTVAAGASGGLGERGVRANARDPTELTLARRAHDIWSVLDILLDAPTGFRRVGHLQLFERDGDLSVAEDILRRQVDIGIECEIVGGDALQELEPELSPLVTAAIHCPIDGVADHTATTIAFAEAARRAGAEIVEGAEVRAVVMDDDRIVALDGGNKPIVVGDALVIAANAGARSLLASVGARLPTFNVHPQVVVTKPLDAPVVSHLIGHAHRPLALKALPGGAVMITGGRLGKDGVLDEAEVEANLADAAAMFPALEGVGVDAAVCDRAESVARDLIPIVDRIPGTANGLVATGWSGRGWAIAPAIAETLSEWLTSGSRPESLAPFGLSRFQGRDIS